MISAHSFSGNPAIPVPTAGNAIVFRPRSAARRSACAVDRCSVCNRGNAESKLNVDVDIGLNFVVTPQVALRVAALLGGTDYVGGTSSVGFSVAWTPKGLKR